jgi:predicted HAD superfamily Cof-like phosphohydrolase
MMGMPLDVMMFQQACDQQPSENNASLYIKLIEEEYKEFVEACNNADEVESLDACMDMIWVILGYCHMKQHNVAGAWDEVLRSNMAKVDPLTGKVRRREDGKILKPEGWKPPNLTKFVKNLDNN